MKMISQLLLLLVAAASFAGAQGWRQASDKELQSIIPARASVINERIETEMRTASGVTDGHGKFIATVVMITAGYAAEGKYSDFLITQVPIKVAGVELKPGNYVFGTHRKDEDTLDLTFYEADTGKLLGSAAAVRDNRHGAIRSLTITPPEAGKASLKIGRFAVPYSVGE